MCSAFSQFPFSALCNSPSLVVSKFILGLQAREGRRREKPQGFEPARFSREAIQMFPRLPQTVKLFTVNFSWKIPNGARCHGCLQSCQGVVRYLGSGVSEMGAHSWKQSVGSCNSLKMFCRRRGGEVQIEES